MMKKIYLDDVRVPVDPTWILVRNYEDFVKTVEEIGFENIEIISLDHDLGDTAMREYFTNVSKNYSLDYSNIIEKTGMDCAKWLVNHYYDKYERVDLEVAQKFTFPQVYTHSANPIGSANIMGYINNFLMNSHKPQTCVRVKFDYTIPK